MKKCRIVKKTYLDGTVKYQIQQKHWLFRWWWCDAYHNYEAFTNDTFDTLEEAEKNSVFFRGLTTTSTSEVVKEY